MLTEGSQVKMPHRLEFVSAIASADDAPPCRGDTFASEVYEQVTWTILMQTEMLGCKKGRCDER